MIARIRESQADETQAERVAPQSRIMLAGKLTGLAAPGGGEIQLLKLPGALQGVGVAARMWRPWEDGWDGCHGLHLVGSQPEFVPVLAAAQARRIPVVISPVAWFDLASCWREPGSTAGRALSCAKFLARRACPRLSSWRRRLYQGANLLLPNSKVEAAQLVKLFGIPWHRIHVVPNGAEASQFAQADPEPFARLAGGTGFVLVPGRIEPRKNQLNLLRALRQTSVKVVVLGDPVPGHEAYFRACRRAAGPHVWFAGRVPHDSSLLASAYAACGCLALTSWFETPGLVALEAGMSGVPLVLPWGGSAPEYFGDLAQYVRPADRAGIRRAVLTALGQPRSPRLAELVRSQFTWRNVALATQAAYERAGLLRPTGAIAA